MLGKLMKHELSATAKLFLPLYIAILALSLIGRLLTWLSSKQSIVDNATDSFAKIVRSLSSIFSAFYVLAFAAVFVLTIIFLIYRFYKNYFTDEGYLMLTLPVRTSSLVFSKILVALIWTVLSLLIIAVSLFITLGHFDAIQDTFNQLKEALSGMIANNADFIKNELGVSVGGFTAEIIVWIVLYVVNIYLAFYVSIAFGQLIYKKHPIVGAVISYILLSIIAKVLSLLYVYVVSNADFIANAIDTSGQALQFTLIGTGVVYLIYSVIMFFLTTGIMKKHLNLD